jgi:branched-chain amino acid aminotransferase
VTPPLSDTLLAGVTRDSVLALLAAERARVEERPLALEELHAAHRAGQLAEVFGTGTAAVVAPVGELASEDGTLTLAPSPDGVAERLGRTLRELQRAERPDPHGWMVPA